MKLRCPACGTDISLSEASQAADLRELDRVAAGFGGDWNLVREYLACFKSKRELPVDKLLRLAKEVYEIWHTGRFAVKGTWYEVGREEFREALTATCNQVTPPLSNHNYLKRVLMGAAEKTARRREASLKEREAELMAGERSKGGTAGPPEEGEGDPEWRQEHLRLLKNLRLAQGKGPEAVAAARAALAAHQAKEGDKVCGHG